MVAQAEATGVARGLIALSLLSLPGCATLRSALSFQEPQVELQRINITGLGLPGAVLLETPLGDKRV